MDPPPRARRLRPAVAAAPGRRRTRSESYDRPHGTRRPLVPAHRDHHRLRRPTVVRRSSSGPARGSGSCAGDAERPRWWATGPEFLGHIVQHAVLDPATARRCSLAASTGHLGPDRVPVHRPRRDLERGERGRPRSAPASRSRAACGRCSGSRPGIRAEPGVWYAGGSPQGLFRSEDAGDTWAPVARLERPSGTGPTGPSGRRRTRRRLAAALGDRRPARSRPPLPRHVGRRRVRVDRRRRATGRRSTTAWRRCSTRARPERSATTRTASASIPPRPDRLYQQNHCGIYRHRPARRASGSGIGDAMPRDVGDIGFSIEVHPRDPDTAWVLPMDGTDVWPRTSPDGRPSLYVTRDGGASWDRRDAGLPERGWFTVKRQATTVDDGDPSGSTSARPAARCGRAPTRARTGRASWRTSPRSTRSSTPPPRDAGADPDAAALLHRAGGGGRRRGRDRRRECSRPRPAVTPACGSGWSTSRAGSAGT